MKLPSIPYLAAAFVNIVRRFPLVILSAFTGVLSAMALIERVGEQRAFGLEELLVTSALGLPLLLATATIAEKWKLEGFKKWLPSLVAVVLLVLYYFTLDFSKDKTGIATMVRFQGLLIAAHLLVAVVPYLNRTPVADFWEYNKRLLGNFIVAAFYSLIIYAGLSVAILAVDNLFNLEINNNIYGHLFVIMAGVVNTSIFLTHFPQTYEGLATEEGPYTVVVKYLSKFILIPIVIIYFLILYAFSIKILTTWELPQGWVAKLVLGFSVAGILTYLLNYLLVKFDDSKLVLFYRRWFFYVLLPMVGLLFVSIGRRISDYGVTEIRYIVVASGIWLLFVCVYFIISRKDDIKLIPASLSIVALLCVLGPFSAFEVSKSSQINRLQLLLTDNGMFADGKALPTTDTLDQEDAVSIRSILNYLQQYDHFHEVAPWFDIEPDSVLTWETIATIEKELNINNYEGLGQSCYFQFPVQQLSEIGGYEQVMTVNVFTASGRSESEWSFAIAASGDALNLYHIGELIDSFDLQRYLQDIAVKYECDKGAYPADEAIVEISGEVYDVKLLIRDLSVEKREKIRLERLEGICLFKRRK